MLKRIPLYLFPIYLSIAEYLLRGFLTYDLDKAVTAPVSIVGPSIVAAGMALLFPVLIPRPPAYRLSPRVQEELERRNLAIYSVADQRVTFAAWVCLFILAGVWVYTLYLAEKIPPAQWHFIPITLLIGAVAYLTGMLLTELKGAP